MDGLRIERTVLPYTLPRPNPPCSGGRREKSVSAPDDLEQTERSGKRERPPYLVDDTAVRVSYDREIGRIVVQVLDERSATVLQQLPSEETAAFLKRFRKMVAPLVDITA